jgi:hypothetical protein
MLQDIALCYSELKACLALLLLLLLLLLQEVEMGTMSVGKDAITQYLAKSKAESATAVSKQLQLCYMLTQH